MSDSGFEEPRRVIWMTPEQRSGLWELVEEKVKTDPDNPDRKHLVRVLNELARVVERERITGRLVENHVSGLRLPHDALPVRVTDTEALAILQLGVTDKVLARLLQPGPIRHGRR